MLINAERQLSNEGFPRQGAGEGGCRTAEAGSRVDRADRQDPLDAIERLERTAGSSTGSAMDWKSRQIEAILEQALLEDKATSDVTTAIHDRSWSARFGHRHRQAGVRDLRAGLYPALPGDFCAAG